MKAEMRRVDGAVVEEEDCTTRVSGSRGGMMGRLGNGFSGLDEAMLLMKVNCICGLRIERFSDGLRQQGQKCQDSIDDISYRRLPLPLSINPTVSARFQTVSNVQELDYTINSATCYSR